MLEPLRRSRYHEPGVLYTRVPDGWTFSWAEPDVNSMVDFTVPMTEAQLLANGPPLVMSVAELAKVAAAMGREPMSLVWYRERMLLERIFDDEVAGVGALLQAPPTTVWRDDGREPVLTVALGAAAWRVARLLVERGEPFAAPPGWSMKPAEYAVKCLDDSPAALDVLRQLIDRGLIAPSTELVRHARAEHVRAFLAQSSAP